MTQREGLELKLKEFIKDQEGKVTLDRALEILHLSEAEKGLFDEVTKELTDQGMLVRSGNKLGSCLAFNLVVGNIEVNPRGFAFVEADDKRLFKEAIYISKQDTRGAMSGDKVLVQLKKKGTSSSKAEGIVDRILVKGDRINSGKAVKIQGKGLYILSKNELWTIEGSHDLKEDDSLLFEAISKGKENIARVIENLGNYDLPGVDITSILKVYGIDEEFPKAVIDEAEKLPKKLSEQILAKEVKKGRKDFRDKLTVTIDSEDTKDVDDAISIEILDNGDYLLGVHIADVSHYVKEGSQLDKEAFKRGTSVYPVGRVVPMLPKELSNGICSLNKGTDRLALSVMMRIDQFGNLVDHRIHESIIRVDYKITYNEIYRIFEEEDQKLIKTFSKYLDQIKLMKELAGILHSARRQRGAIDFNIPETKVELDDQGKAISVSPYKTTFANNIIEEFMLMCNETVAERFYWTNIPFMYRVHDEPSEEKMEELATFIRNFGYSFKKSAKVHPKSLQKLLDQVEGSPAKRIISTKLLRSMQKAAYRPTNDGHFGLALKYYSHFTSPIRRYPDLFIHRMIKYSLNGLLNPEKERQIVSRLDESADHCSKRERAAIDAERECTDLKVCQYMKDFEGRSFSGIISNITGFGFYVELENTAEGLVKFASLSDYYEFDPKTLSAYGERTGRTFKIGQELDVTLDYVNINDRQIDFTITETKFKGRKRR